MFFTKRQSAFTMIELVIVIVLLGLLSISFSKILSSSVSNYIDAKDRNHHSQLAKWAIEVISRSVREALPQSIRSNNVGVQHCVEFMEILNATSYFNFPETGIIGSFNIVTFDLVFQAGQSVAIMPIDAPSVYAGNGINGVVSPVTSIAASGLNQSLITLTVATDFTQRSPQNRVYILTTPTSYCLNDSNGQLTRFTNYGIQTNQSFPPAGGTSELISEDFWANGTVFDYQTGTLQRSGLLQIDFLIQDRVRYSSGGSEEAFQVFHEVHIRNVP